MKTDEGVLTGLKVIDCATSIAGPEAATILSDFGADVVKVERPPDACGRCERRASREIDA